MRRAPILLLLAFAGCATSSPAVDRAAILKVLEDQKDAWNRGDLDAFVAGYHRSDDLVFAGGDQVHRGFDAMVRRYRDAYPTREKMGTLTFSNVRFEQQDDDRAVTTGSWELVRTGSDRRPGGVFTLIWKKFADGWKIVHDHTSSRP